jgi:hypothetical protein
LTEQSSEPVTALKGRPGRIETELIALLCPLISPTEDNVSNKKACADLLKVFFFFNKYIKQKAS